MLKKLVSRAFKINSCPWKVESGSSEQEKSCSAGHEMVMTLLLEQVSSLQGSMCHILCAMRRTQPAMCTVKDAFVNVQGDVFTL